MFFPKFLSSSGREEIRGAHEGKEKLEKERLKNGLLKGAKVKELERLSAITRRDLFEKIIVGLGLTFGLAGGSILFLSQSKEGSHGKDQKKDPIQTIHKTGLTEEQMDILISGIEEGFAEWEKEIRASVEKNRGLPLGVTPEHFYAPFQNIAFNQKNSVKNLQTHIRVNEKRGETRIENINYFSYGTLNEMDAQAKKMTFAAFFNPVRRSLYLDEDCDPYNPTDRLVIYHEVMHALYDANERMQIHTKEEAEEYIESFRVKPGGKMRINIFTEIDAYGSELEIADIMMNGTLRNGTATMEDMLRILRPRPAQVSTITMLHRLASLYFPHGISDGLYNPLFVQYVKDEYRKRGFEVYLKQ